MNNFTAQKHHQHRKESLVVPLSDFSPKCRDNRLAPGKQSSQTNSRKKLAYHQSRDFPIIFTKRKRQEYSGYKQLNFNKSKFVKFDETQRERYFKCPERKYEANLKNIMKLKKRYSLQPTYFKTLYKEENRANKVMSVKLQLQSNITIKETKQQFKLRQLMKNILLQHNIQQKIPIFYPEEDSYITSQRLTEHQKITEFQRYKSQFYPENTNGLPQKAKNTNGGFRISLQKTDSSRHDSKKKDRIYIKTQQTEGPTLRNNELQRQLCGWQNKTVYDSKNQTILPTNGFFRKAKQKQ